MVVEAKWDENIQHTMMRTQRNGPILSLVRIPVSGAVETDFLFAAWVVRICANMHAHSIGADDQPYPPPSPRVEWHPQYLQYLLSRGRITPFFSRVLLSHRVHPPAGRSFIWLLLSHSSSCGVLKFHFCGTAVHDVIWLLPRQL